MTRVLGGAGGVVESRSRPFSVDDTMKLLRVAPWIASMFVAFAVNAQSVSSTGLIYKSLKDGNGAQPRDRDTVRVHYRGTLADGKEFDSSYKRGEPAEFPLNRVIPCWTEGVQKMKVGGKAQLTCPPSIAYGPRGAGGVIPPNATLTFEIELLSVK